MDHMGAPKEFGRKFGRKSDQNFTDFFFQKIDIKNRSETQFHKNRQYRTDSRLCARHGSDVQFFDFFQLKNEILENP